MALSDPQSVTVNTVAKSMPRIQTEQGKSIYQKDDQTFRLTVSHQTSGTRVRHMVRLDEKKVAADPLTAVNSYQTTGVYLVIDEPAYGFTDTEINYDVQALVAWLTQANVLKVLALEH